jgi:CrcB protein
MPTALTPYLLVALGGAIGATCRFALVAALARPGFPVGVMAANVAGSFAMGVLAAWLGRRGLTGAEALLLSGVLGGFTTFSAFSLEAVTLIERGALGAALAYVALSVGLSLGALGLGLALGRLAG